MESALQLYQLGEEIVQAGTVEEAMEQMKCRTADMVFVDINLKQESEFQFVAQNPYGVGI